MKGKMKEKLIVALDVDKKKIPDLVYLLKEHVWGFKVGLRLFVQEGPRIIWYLKTRGCKVFLDLKFFDIPNTVYSAVKQLYEDLELFNVDMLNMHIFGCSEMLMKVSQYVHSEVAEELRPVILGVTILTSIEDGTLQSELMIPYSVEDYVLHLAGIAEKSGLDGVVASPQEITKLRAVSAPNFKIVTPSIRMPESKPDDQKRKMTPYEAIRAGADYIVVGRPIVEAVDPLNATINILADMKRAEDEKAKKEGDEIL